MVLYGGGDDVAAHPAVVPADGAEGPVVPLRSTGGEKEPPRLTAHRLCHRGPPRLHAALHFKAHGVLGAGIAELLGENSVHNVRHGPGNWRGGGVIQIDHKNLLLPKREKQRIIKEK